MSFFDKMKQATEKIVIGDGSHKVAESKKYIKSIETHNEALAVEKVARAHHKDSMETWKREHHPSDPKMRPTTDAAWSATHGGAGEVDIAHTEWDDLPSDWKDTTSAQIAVREVMNAGGAELDNAFTDRVAEMIHVAWLERKGGTATAEQREAYQQLSQIEKEKDRLFVELAIEVQKEGAK